MRKAWIVASVAVGGALSFVMLLVVGVYLVAGNVAGAGGRAGGLAKGAVPGEVTSPSCRSGATSARRLPPRRCWPPSSTRRAGWNPGAVSPADARGIAQFIPGTWATHGIDGDGDGDRDIWDPNDAIPSAASYDCGAGSATCPRWSPGTR